MENTTNPIPTPTLPQSTIPTPTSKFPFLKSKAFKIGAVITLVILVLAIGLIINSRRVAVTIPEQQTGEDLLLVTVGEQKIYKSDVEKAADAEYQKSAITKEVLDNFLNQLIEKAILDQEATKQGITVTVTTDKAKYDLIREKIMAQFINSVSAYTVSYWTPGSDYPEEEITGEQREEFTRVRAEAKTALPEIETLIKSGTEPFAAATQVSKKYPSLGKVLGVNGYTLDTKNTDKVNYPKIYTEDNRKTLGDLFFNAIFTSTEGEVKLVFDSEGARGFVIKTIKVTTARYASYTEWLSAKKGEVLTINNQL